VSIAVPRLGGEAHGELLWVGAVGAGIDPGHELSSHTTQERGLVATVDLAPTILEALRAPVPDDVRGRVLETTGGTLDVGALRTLAARLRVVGGRRLSAFGFLLCGWLLLVLLCAPWPRARSRAVRTGAVGVLWAPLTVMIPAAFAPSAGVEYATIALACLALGALSDALLPWPRAMIAPAIACPIGIAIDALAHTQLLMRSLLGPNPILGARFYGVGNELKSGLAVLVLAAVAGALYRSRRDRRAIVAIVLAGLALAVVEGAERIGAGVGGVILVCAGTAVAAVTVAPGTLDRRRLPGRRARAARRDRSRDRPRKRPFHRQRAARALRRRHPRHPRTPLQSCLGRASQPCNAGRDRARPVRVRLGDPGT
jgi:hypothetical protein